TFTQGKMMAKAGRYHAVRGAALLSLLLLLGWAVSEVYGRLLVNSIVTTETGNVPRLVEQLPPPHLGATARLRRHLHDAPEDSKARLDAGLGLVGVDEGQVDYLYERLLDVSPTQLSVIRDALAEHKETLTDKLWSVLGDEQQKPDQRFRAACALAGYDTAGDG